MTLGPKPPIFCVAPIEKVLPHPDADTPDGRRIERFGDFAAILSSLDLGLSKIADALEASGITGHYGKFPSHRLTSPHPSLRNHPTPRRFTITRPQRK